MRLILASGSPRRKELLDLLGIDFEIIPSTVKEKMMGETPYEVVMSLSEQKAEDVFVKQKAQGQGEDFAVLGADTIVFCDGARLGKPKDEEDACRMLRILSGRSHEVYTGVTLQLFQNRESSRQSFFDCTRVEMYPISDEEIAWYVGTKEPMDKAGAYAIQGKGSVFIKGIHGDYQNVVGLPVAKVWRCLRECGVIEMRN